jgi:hypothetical protein
MEADGDKLSMSAKPTEHVREVANAAQTGYVCVNEVSRHFRFADRLGRCQ